MMNGLVLIGLIAVMTLLWRRQNELEERLANFAGMPIFPEAASPTPEIAAPPPQHIADEPIHLELSPAPRTVIRVPGPEQEPAFGAQHNPRARIEFEELFGRRLPIWAGGITLAVAGVLIVRFSIHAGFFPPLVRVLGGLVFGQLLIAGAEVAHRHSERVRDPRVAQALSGAGLATLYATVLIASTIYHLIAPMTAFVGLAGVTAAAMGLALRFGSPSALLGLVGGMAAPALTGSSPANVPLLALYLTLVVGGLFAVSRRQRWTWLGIGALAGGLGWGGLLIAGGTLDAVATVSIGLYLLLIGFAVPLMASTGGQARMVRAAGSLFAALEIAALVATGGFAMLDWGLFGLISVAIVWLARTDRKLAALPALGLAIALVLIAAWPHPPVNAFIAVLVGTALLYGTPAFLRVWKAEGSVVEAGSIAALGLAGLILALLHYHGVDRAHDLPFAGLALLCAAFPGGAALFGWKIGTRGEDARLATLVTASAMLVAAAAILALPLWAIPTTVGAVGLAVLLLGRAAGDPRLKGSAWTMVAVAILLLALDPNILDELARACGLAAEVKAIAVPRWAGLALVLAGFGWRGAWRRVVEGAQGIAVLGGYLALAQIAAADWLPLVPAAAIPLLAAWNRTGGGDRLIAAVVTAFCLSSAWALAPFTNWLTTALASLWGQPVLLSELPGLHDAVVCLLIPGIAVLGAIATSKERLWWWRRAIAVVVVSGVVAAHILYKHVFALGTQADFVRSGLVERTVWETLLVGAAALAWWVGRHRTGGRSLAIGLGAAALAHDGFYSILMHNPLWTAQEVGAFPVLNWLLPTYAVPLGLLWATSRLLPEPDVRLERARAIAQMLLIVSFGASELRQVFHGTLLSSPGVIASEDVLRSVSAVAIAIGFLLWGLRGASHAAHTWRVGSLALMLAAVCKVFLIDAAGLDGLLRIASFVALGFSLIGIGWLYSRYFKADPSITA